jgi:predicted ester cyclase
MTSTDENKEIARRYFEAGSRNDFGAWDDLCDPAMILHTGFTEPMRGIEAVKGFTAGMHRAFSEYSLSIDDLFAEGDRVVVRSTTHGTHTAPLISPSGDAIPPTGKRMAMSVISILRVEDGKIVEERAQADIMGGLQQLGIIPTPGGGT